MGLEWDSRVKRFLETNPDLMSDLKMDLGNG